MIIFVSFENRFLKWKFSMNKRRGIMKTICWTARKLGLEINIGLMGLQIQHGDVSDGCLRTPSYYNTNK